MTRKLNDQLPTRHKSAFTTLFGKYEFLRMLFELVHGLEHFTALMEIVLGQFNDFCFFHMDGILVHNCKEKDHLEHLRITFLKLREAGLKLKLLKCVLLKDISNI